MTTYRFSSMPLRDLSNLTISQDTVRQIPRLHLTPGRLRWPIWGICMFNVCLFWFLCKNILGSLDLSNIIKIFIHPLLQGKPKVVWGQEFLFLHWSDTLSTYFRTNILLGDPIDNLKLVFELGTSLPLRVFRKDPQLLFRGFWMSGNVQEGWDL